MDAKTVKKYDIDSIAYTILQLVVDGYIKVEHKELINRLDHLDPGRILYITPKGHDFIASIHNCETWKSKIHPILDKVGNVSLSVIESVSKGVASAAIEKFMTDVHKPL